MSRYIKLFIILVIPALLLANADNKMAEQYLEITGRATDFAPRIFNFVLLVALLYYLLANPIKEFLKNRTNSIASELAEIERRRQASKDAKIKAEEDLESAKIKAKEIIEDAKAEIALIKQKIANHTEQELSTLEKVANEKMKIEERKVIKETTLNVLSESISSDDIPLDTSKIINIVTKEVA